MERGKQSSSSFTSDLFGTKDSRGPSSSSGIFGSIFPPPSKVLRRESAYSLETERKNGSSEKNGISGNSRIGREGQSHGTTNKDVGSYYQEEKVPPPLYGSSIYYGGQDVCSRPQSTRSPTFTTDQFNKDGGEDETGSASRGNWWQGSLYY